MSDFDPGPIATKLLESLPDLVYIVDMDGRLVWWNDRLNEVTGYDDEALSALDAFGLVPADQREAAVAAFAKVGTYDPETTMEFDVLTSDGDRIPHEFNGSVIGLDDRTVVATVARDVTPRRERDREIRRQRDELETLNSISETVYEVIQAVIDAATREEIESAVCERLAASDLYQAVWIARNDTGGTVEPVGGVAATDDFVETIAELNDLDWKRPAEVAVETGEIQVIQGFADSVIPDRAKAVAETLDVHSGASVPVVHRGTVDGVLSVYSSRLNAFSAREQAAFERLGEVIGFATNAVRTERLLLSDTATELTFRISGPDALLASLSSEADGPCRKEWSTAVEDGEGNYRHYVTVEGLDPERVREMAADRSTIESIEHVGDNGDEHVFGVVTSDSFTRRLIDVGATPTSMIARDGETTIVAELSGDADVRPVVEAANELYDAALVSKRDLERPVRTTDEYHHGVADRLSDQQLAALRHAYFGGYFSWPRDATAEEIAERMAVSSPTFHYHLRHAQRALVDAFLEHLED